MPDKLKIIDRQINAIIMGEFLTYSKFYTNEDAQQFVELLNNAGIETRIEHDRNPLDKIYLGETPDPMFVLKIPADCFEDANKIVSAQAESQLDNINPDYYLFSFTNDELIEVVQNKNEWNEFDQALAGKILAERNIVIPVKIHEATKAEFKPKRIEAAWLVAEYIISITISFIGIIIGLVTLNAYTILPDGKKVKMFDKFTIGNAKLMLIIGVIRLGLWLLILFGKIKVW